MRLKTTLLIALTALTLPLAASAQTFSIGGFSIDLGGNSCNSSVHSRQDVYVLDQLAHQMTYAYNLEVRFNPRCECSRNLLKHMYIHMTHTARLRRASQASCPVTYKKAACAVNDSAKCLHNLSRKAKASWSVRNMLSQTCTLANRVHKNAHLWRSVSHPPVSRSPYLSYPPLYPLHRSYSPRCR
jgi:hypothetical protein